jgi:hypothetical protein
LANAIRYQQTMAPVMTWKLPSSTFEKHDCPKKYICYKYKDE